MINGDLLKSAFISGANELYNNVALVNSLNVFPVADGDTGVNMYMTIKAGVKAAEELGDVSHAGALIKTAASAMIRAARGNSGVILSVFFKGFSDSVCDKNELDAADIARGFMLGMELAYSSVAQPVEGTILTVIRACTDTANHAAVLSHDEKFVWQSVTHTAQKTLEKTTSMLKQLRQANVVDSGAMGFSLVISGMNKVISTGEMTQMGKSYDDTPLESVAKVLEDESIKYSYCTEFTLQKSDFANVGRLRKSLTAIGGSVVLVEDEGCIKAHCHTNSPGKVLDKALHSGTIVSMKIENMVFQNQQLLIENGSGIKQKFAIVAVSPGAGISSIFTELGVKKIINAGNKMNPSTQEILDAIEESSAQTIFLLPNNKNIILAAKQAEKISKRNVMILPTQSVPQGIAALTGFDENTSCEENYSNMLTAVQSIQTGMITMAHKDASADNMNVKKGQIIGIENGKIVAAEDEYNVTFEKLTRSLARKSKMNLLTVLKGLDVTDEHAQKTEMMLRNEYPDFDIKVLDGGQKVYDYMIYTQ